MKILRIACLILVLLAQGCSAANVPGTRPAAATATATLPGAATPVSSAQPPPTLTQTPAGPLTLRIWAPPQFDPSQDTPAARLLRARLDEFSRQRPLLALEVRVKGLRGPGGLLDALTTSKAAAPQAAPDLIALPRDLLETAALKGLLAPFSPSSYAEAEQEWYDYARDLARLQDSVYGLPFAGDALALAYRPSTWPQPPETWDATLQTVGGLVFHANDPQALLTLAFYQARHGPIRDEQSKPVIDSLVLTEVLTYYAQARTLGVITADIAQMQMEEQAWKLFADGGAAGVFTWTSRFLGETSDAQAQDRSLAPLPTYDGQPYTLANGWVWSVSSPDAERQRVAAELARFLTDDDFLSQWTEVAGYLPPSPGILASWEDQSLQAVLERIARSAHILPPGDILAALSGPLWQATTAVLGGQSDPAKAAQQAAAGLPAP